MRVLDICCCSGGASMGLCQAYQRTGIEPYVCGADIKNPDSYLFEFIQSDTRNLSLGFIRSFGFVWLSPPCQAHSLACVGSNKEYPDLVPSAQDFMYQANIPYCMENVPQTPLRRDLLLCGEMFGLGMIRRRHFEMGGFEVPQPFHKMHSGRVIDGEKVTITGNGFGGSGKIKDWQKAIGIDWITDRWSLAQAVPSACSQCIMSCFLDDPDYRLLVDDLLISSDGWYYQQGIVQCGRPNCEYQRGKLHDPYWMRYKQIGKRRVEQYVGKSYVSSYTRRFLCTGRPFDPMHCPGWNVDIKA